jgi:plastocyanin
MNSPRTIVFASTLATVGAFTSTGAFADDDHGDHERNGKIVSVAFGAGLNTAQPGNAQNHHILPDTIKVKVGDVVNFVVAGLHVIRVYDRGVRLRDIKDEIPDECEVNPVPSTCFPGGPVPVIPTFDLAVYYQGLNSIPPAPAPAVPPFAPLSLAQNRVEPVSFLKPGRFLVICAVLPHFNDKMFAWVEVTPNNDH